LRPSSDSLLSVMSARSPVALPPDRLLTQRIMQVGGALVPLQGVLEQAVADNSWIEQFGMGADFGMGDPADPYVRACRAECMLAVLMLHLEQVDVNFIDSDRLEVLRGVGASSSLQAVRTALEV
jgi:hypothetical protein